MAVQLNKVVLEKKGQASKINLSKDAQIISRIQVKLSWTKAVDLDLHAFYITKSGESGHVYFGKKKAQSIQLDKDAGVGNTAGDNQENLTVGNLDEFKYILFATNIFRFLSFLHGGDSFSKYDGKILITTDVSQVEVPLNAKQKGKWASIALLDNSGAEPEVVNINEITDSEPEIEKYKNRR